MLPVLEIGETIGPSPASGVRPRPAILWCESDATSNVASSTAGTTVRRACTYRSREMRRKTYATVKEETLAVLSSGLQVPRRNRGPAACLRKRKPRRAHEFDAPENDCAMLAKMYYKNGGRRKKSMRHARSERTGHLGVPLPFRLLSLKFRFPFLFLFFPFL